MIQNNRFLANHQVMSMYLLGIYMHWLMAAALQMYEAVIDVDTISFKKLEPLVSSLVNQLIQRLRDDRRISEFEHNCMEHVLPILATQIGNTRVAILNFEGPKADYHSELYTMQFIAMQSALATYMLSMLIIRGVIGNLENMLCRSSPVPLLPPAGSQYAAGAMYTSIPANTATNGTANNAPTEFQSKEFMDTGMSTILSSIIDNNDFISAMLMVFALRSIGENNHESRVHAIHFNHIYTHAGSTRRKAELALQSQINTIWDRFIQPPYNIDPIVLPLFL